VVPSLGDLIDKLRAGRRPAPAPEPALTAEERVS